MTHGISTARNAEGEDYLVDNIDRWARVDELPDVSCRFSGAET